MKNAKRKATPARPRAPRRDRVRGTSRRGSAAAVAVRQLDAAAYASYGIDRRTIEAAPPPALAFHFGLVEHGYEIRVFEDGQYRGAVCRGFSGNHKIEALKESLVDAIEKAVKAWKAAL